MERHEAVVIGGGPAGLAAAARLIRRGVRDVVVFEREKEAGGVPRHCGHWGFGWESHRGLTRGPGFAAWMRDEARGADVRTGTAVIGFLDAHRMRIVDASGQREVAAARVVVATGARETSRAARLIGGVRAAGVMNTGTLQQLVYLKGLTPFRRPVILGGEWVSFSALMTCRHAGITPAAMIVEERELAAPRLFALGARLRYGVPVETATRLVEIGGGREVEWVEVETAGMRRRISCDGVIVSGQFVPEDWLFASGPLATAEKGRLGHIAFAGNAQGPLKTAGRCVAEARRIIDSWAL